MTQRMNAYAWWWRSRGTEPCVFMKGIKRRLVATAASLFFIREAATERHKTGK